jgi:rhamnulokinase
MAAQADAPTYAAIDLGASSARAFTGRLRDGTIELRERLRTPNRPVHLPDGLHWDVLHLFSEALGSLQGAGPLHGVGIDAWGVDYGLLDGRGRLLGLPYHYRDARTAGMVDRAQGRITSDEAYAIAGIQTMPINTVFQLMAEEGSSALAAAAHLALIPDLFALWLSGELANERTIASTTGLLDARSGAWADGLIEALELPRRLFGELVDPGTVLAPVRPEHDLGSVPVFAVASHDTASAFVAAPVRDEHAAILSSGTWSLLGIELGAPALEGPARDADLTNERGVDGTTRLLKNVMGLWLEQECARAWGADHAELFRAGAEAQGPASLFDPDDEALLAPGDMPARIAATCERLGQPAPADRGQTIRSILVSLACKYRFVLELLETAAERELRRIHVVGGGARVEALCRLTADISGREVLAGPVEATALGNVLVQARAAGELGSLADMRAAAAASSACRTFEPSPRRDEHDATYAHFLELTGLRRSTLA